MRHSFVLLFPSLTHRFWLHLFQIEPHLGHNAFHALGASSTLTVAHTIELKLTILITLSGDSAFEKSLFVPRHCCLSPSSHCRSGRASLTLSLINGRCVSREFLDSVLPPLSDFDPCVLTPQCKPQRCGSTRLSCEIERRHPQSAATKLALEQTTP